MKKATAGVIWIQDQVLIAKRQKDQYWEFPGGKIDPGETPQDCLVREIKEELNITVRVKDFITRVQGHYRGRDMDVHAFHVVWVDGEIDLSVHTEIRRVDVSELKNFSFIDEDREIVKVIQS